MIVTERLDEMPGGGAAVPDGHLVYAVGDIHGRSDLLADLLAAVAEDAETSAEAARRTLVFVGDYVDRGPDSRGVIERLLARMPAGFGRVALKGNHEDFLLRFLDDPTILPVWLMNGADATLASYDAALDDDTTAIDRPSEVARRFARALPPAHLAFLRELPLSHVVGDYFFTHAGVRPGVPLEHQAPRDLIWIRREFLQSEANFGKIVVHGHTPHPDPVVRANRIGIDTGAWTTGRLTALRLEGSTRAFLTAAAN